MRIHLSFFYTMRAGLVLAVTALMLPEISHAQSRGSFSNVRSFSDLILRISEIINLLIPLVISLTVLVFIWGIFKLVMAGDSSDARKEARSTIVFGVVALFVMVSVWGLVNVLKASFFGTGLIIPQLR